LGAFNYKPLSMDDGVKRTKRQLTILVSGEKYEGEWNDSTGRRDG
jgi:hypothetical protein